MELFRRVVDAADVSAGRINLLQGLYWGSGGFAVVMATVLGAFPGGWQPGLYAVGGGAMLLGIGMGALPQRGMPELGHAALGVLGGMAITAVVFWAGPVHVALPGVIYAYLTGFTLIAVRRYAAAIIVLTAFAHLAVLLTREVPGLWGVWSTTWIIATVAGVLSGEAVAASLRAQAEQSRLLQELRQADQAKTALLHAVNHELARPMTAVAGLSETLVARGDQLSGASRQQLAERILAGAERLQDTLSELLGVTRMATGRVPLELERITVGDLLDRALERADLDGDDVHRDAPEELVLVVDPGRMALAIANLLTNARRYGGDGRIDLVVSSVDDGAGPHGATVTVEVADRGPGIAEDARAAVFEPFVRADATHVGMGTGLGLSLVREFLRLHGGDAWLEGRDGGGTVAVVRFPRVAAGRGSTTGGG